ncbi:MAG TPA: hypothetical protein VMR73_02055 [Candidatus Paceibacterota bacterium]|nr:hypothetical protein [Candidatus Paceibacterota bacterium]
MKFQLTTIVGYAVGSCHDDRSLTFEDEINAADKKEAIEKARKLVNAYHEKNNHLTDYCLRSTLMRKIWVMHDVGEQRAEPARKAVPCMSAHLKEVLL